MSQQGILLPLSSDDSAQAQRRSQDDIRRVEVCKEPHHVPLYGHAHSETVIHVTGKHGPVGGRLGHFGRSSFLLTSSSSFSSSFSFFLTELL